jgi:hypothetical protein
MGLAIVPLLLLRSICYEAGEYSENGEQQEQLVNGLNGMGEGCIQPFNSLCLLLARCQQHRFCGSR